MQKREQGLPVSVPMLISPKFAAVAAAGPPLDPPGKIQTDIAVDWDTIWRATVKRDPHPLSFQTWFSTVMTHSSRTVYSSLVSKSRAGLSIQAVFMPVVGILTILIAFYCCTRDWWRGVSWQLSCKRKSGHLVRVQDMPVVLSKAYGFRTMPKVLPTDCIADSANSAEHKSWKPL